MLQLNEEDDEEDDDATSKLAKLSPKDEPMEVIGPDTRGLQSGGAAASLREVSILVSAYLFDLLPNLESFVELSAEVGISWP